MTASPEGARSEIVRVDEEVHLPLLVSFIRQVWSPELQLADLRRARERAATMNPATPGQAPPTFLFLLDGEAVGHLTTIPTRLQYRDWSGPAHWLKGFWVLPEHRNGPIGAMLVREAARQLDCLLATVVDAAPRRVFGAFKMQDLGCFSEHVKLLRPKNVLKSLDLTSFGSGSHASFTRAASSAALRVAGLPGIADLAGGILNAAFAMRAATARGAKDLRVQKDAPSEMGLDALWLEVAAGNVCSPVRDATYRKRVYEDLSNETYGVVSLERAGMPAAWATIRCPREGAGHPRLGKIRLATLSDVVVPARSPEDALALLREAERAARDLGADALLCSATHPGLRRWLSQRAFVSVGGTLHLAVRGPRDGPTLPDTLDGWWLTRADGGADEGL